jgi:hypothetical protein
MENQFGFVLKVFILSALLSALIKYVGPALSIVETDTSALIAVFLPSVVIGIALGARIIWKFQQQKPN